MAKPIELLDSVALACDVPSQGLSAGEIGTVVEVYGGNSAYEVEFCDDDGRTYGLLALKAHHIVPLHNCGRAFKRELQSA